MQTISIYRTALWIFSVNDVCFVEHRNTEYIERGFAFEIYLYVIGAHEGVKFPRPNTSSLEMKKEVSPLQLSGVLQGLFIYIV